MGAGVKFVIGLIIAIAGIYWYVADYFRVGVPGWIGGAAISALKTVFIGVFGLLLLFVGLIIAWIEYEDLKWESKERKLKAEKEKKKK